MTSLFGTYAPRRPAYDEMFDTLGQVRPGYAGVHEAMARLSPAQVRARADDLSRTYVDQGVTFDIGGQERPFPLDLVPRLVDAQTWTHIELGVAQRVRALERFLAESCTARATCSPTASCRARWSGFPPACPTS